MKIPRDLTCDGFVGVVSKKPVKCALIIALDGNLREQIERYALLRAELSDLAVGSRLLVAEIVGGERQDAKPLVLIFLED